MPEAGRLPRPDPALRSRASGRLGSKCRPAYVRIRRNASSRAPEDTRRRLKSRHEAFNFFRNAYKMFPGLAEEKDLVPVWVCAGDFCALGLLPPGAQCDETIHVLLSLPYWLVIKLWHKGRGRSSSGEPLVAFDGRLILARTRKPGLLVQSSRLAKYAALPLAALAGSAQAQSSLSPVQSLQTQLRLLGKIDHFSKFKDLKTIEENTVRQDPGFVAKAMIDRNLGEWVGSYNDYTNM